MSTPLTTCGNYNNVTSPDFLSHWTKAPLQTCTIYYNGSTTATATLERCCGANVPIDTFNDGCLQYCNYTGNPFAWEACVSGNNSAQFGTCVTMGVDPQAKSEASRGGKSFFGWSFMVLLVTGLVEGLL